MCMHVYVYIAITEWRKHLRVKTNLMDNDYHDKVCIIYSVCVCVCVYTLLLYYVKIAYTIFARIWYTLNYIYNIIILYTRILYIYLYTSVIIHSYTLVHSTDLTLT